MSKGDNMRDAKTTEPKCSWCDKMATAKGTDGTYSCGQGQGDGLESHDTRGVVYTTLYGGFGWERIR